MEQEHCFQKTLERVWSKIQEGLAIFQDCKLLQSQLVELIHSSSYLQYMERYFALADNYLLKLIQNSQVTLKDQKTKIDYSYFFEQSLKIENTNYYPYLNRLIELNFIKFMDRLLSKVQLYSFQQIVNANKLCDLECLGCNQFYYQFLPIQVNNRKRNYKLIFVNNSNSAQRNPINKQTEIYIQPNRGYKVDLLHLQNDLGFLRQIVSVLNYKGGFIMIGSKRIQQFYSIKSSYSYQQLSNRFMETYFVMGQSINKEMQNKIIEGISKLIEKLPQIKMEENIQISFIPVKQSPFKLGFNLQSIKMGNQQFKQRQLHVVLIKLNPSKSKYEYFVSQDFEEQFSYDVFAQQIPQYDEMKEFMKSISQGVSLQQQIKQAFIRNNQISYFDDHKTCSAFIKQL